MTPLSAVVVTGNSHGSLARKCELSLAIVWFDFLEAGLIFLHPRILSQVTILLHHVAIRQDMLQYILAVQCCCMFGSKDRSILVQDGIIPSCSTLAPANDRQITQLNSEQIEAKRYFDINAGQMEPDHMICVWFLGRNFYTP